MGLCIPGWPWTHNNCPALTSWVLGLLTCITMPGYFHFPFKLFILILIVYMHMGVYTGFVCVCVVPKKARRESVSPGAGVIGCCELPNLGVRNWTLICKNNMCSYPLSHLFFPSLPATFILMQSLDEILIFMSRKGGELNSSIGNNPHTVNESLFVRRGWDVNISPIGSVS